MFSGQFVTKRRPSETIDPGTRVRPVDLASRSSARSAAVATALFCVLGAAGCASPLQRIDSIAAAAGFQRTLVQGGSFRHAVYSGVASKSNQSTLRVYIEGDGSPYRGRYVVTPDPTPRQPVMLRLMSLDPTPAVYVGRPCYFGLADEAPCEPLDWTLGRFSEEIVASMAVVIRGLAQEADADEILLIGHSGGGAMAVLLARRMPEVTHVVTLAGLLDTDAWAVEHAYTPLRYSLNPVEGGALPRSITQSHFAAADDTNVPPGLIQRAAERLGAGTVIVLPQVSHSKGWGQHWPAILAGQ
mgnify:FL=1